MIKNNKVVIFILMSITFCSCQTTGLRKSGRMVEGFEKAILADYEREYGGEKKFEKELKYINKQHIEFFRYRKDIINKFINKKKIKDFVLEESISIDDPSGLFMYFTTVITPDSIFYFSKNIYSDRFKAYPYKPDNYSLFYIYKGDSILVTSRIEYVNYNMKNEKFYISNFNKGKLDQFTVNDSVVFKKKDSKMLVDLEIESWSTPDGICLKKGDFVTCGDVLYGNCEKNDRNEIISCDTIKVKTSE